MHTCGSSAPRQPWHMRPVEGESRRVLLCTTCGQTETIIPRGPLQAETLDYRSTIAKASAHLATRRGHAAAEAQHARPNLFPFVSSRLTGPSARLPVVGRAWGRVFVLKVEF